MPHVLYVVSVPLEIGKGSLGLIGPNRHMTVSGAADGQPCGPGPSADSKVVGKGPAANGKPLAYGAAAHRKAADSHAAQSYQPQAEPPEGQKQPQREAAQGDQPQRAAADSHHSYGAVANGDDSFCQPGTKAQADMNKRQAKYLYRADIFIVNAQRPHLRACLLIGKATSSLFGPFQPHQPVDGHAKEPGQLHQLLQLRGALPHLPLGDCLPGDSYLIAQFLLRPPPLPAQGHKMFRKVHGKTSFSALTIADIPPPRQPNAPGNLSTKVNMTQNSPMGVLPQGCQVNKN